MKTQTQYDDGQFNQVSPIVAAKKKCHIKGQWIIKYVYYIHGGKKETNILEKKAIKL